MDQGTLAMTQRDRDRLVVLKKAQKGLIRQREAAQELGVTERHVRRLLVKLREVGDRESQAGREGAGEGDSDLVARSIPRVSGGSP